MTYPDLSFEKKLWSQGFSLVIGVDEVGRGALAGPVVAGACALRTENHELGIKNQELKNNKKDNAIHDSCFKIPDSILKLGINDSKKISPKKREIISQEIKKHFFYAVGESSVSVINSFGIKIATEKAMRMAVIDLLLNILKELNTDVSPQSISLQNIKKLNPYLLIDAFQVRYVPIVGLAHQQAIIKGDEKSISIAAASILAKVYRDDLMKKLAKEFPAYGWEENAGYGTARHISAIKKYNVTKIHRTKFVDGIIGS